MMGFAILFMGSAIIFCISYKFCESGKNELVFAFLAVASLIIGSILLYFSGVGEIGRTLLVESSIYKVAGQIQSSAGPVAIIENGKKNVYAVWGDKIPNNAQFIRIGKNGEVELVETAEQANKKGVTIKNPVAK